VLWWEFMSGFCEKLIEVVACLLVADFITGVVHWIEDTYGVPSWPIIGKLVIEPNIEHHQQPGLLGSMSSLALRNYQSIIPASFAAIAALLWFGLSAWPFVLIAAISATGNEVHTWSHRKRNSRWVTFLQEAGLVQSPRAHAKHHRPPFDTHFCTLTNFTNEVLELVRFWRIAEFFVWLLLGALPKRMSEERQGV